MKPLIIYHNHCTDGFGAAFAAWMKFGYEAEYLPASYGDKDKFWKNEDGTFDSELTILNREVYILDFSFDRWIMEGLLDLTKRVVWLDHHKTAFEMWCGEAPNLFFTLHREQDEKKHIVLDDCKSGALLAWEYFHPDTEVPLLIQHIDDRDRWQFKLEGSKELHAGLNAQPFSFAAWKMLIPIGTSDWGRNYADVVSRGRLILSVHQEQIKQQAKQDIVCGIKNGDNVHIGLAVNTQNHISETGHVLANKSSTYGLCWYVAADGKVKCSLRSNGDYDVSAIAKAFGGGGHRNAAGFETDIDTLKGWLA